MLGRQGSVPSLLTRPPHVPLAPMDRARGKVLVRVAPYAAGIADRAPAGYGRGRAGRHHGRGGRHLSLRGVRPHLAPVHTRPGGPSAAGDRAARRTATVDQAAGRAAAGAWRAALRVGRDRPARGHGAGPVHRRADREPRPRCRREPPNAVRCARDRRPLPIPRPPLSPSTRPATGSCTPCFPREGPPTTWRCCSPVPMDWLSSTVFTAELVAGEPVTNATRYGDHPIRLRLIHDDTTLICEVSDTSHTAPHLRRARTYDEGGRGLLLRPSSPGGGAAATPWRAGRSGRS